MLPWVWTNPPSSAGKGRLAGAAAAIPALMSDTDNVWLYSPFNEISAGHGRIPDRLGESQNYRQPFPASWFYHTTWMQIFSTRINSQELQIQASLKENLKNAHVPPASSRAGLLISSRTQPEKDTVFSEYVHKHEGGFARGGDASSQLNQEHTFFLPPLLPDLTAGCCPLTREWCELRRHSCYASTWMFRGSH